MRTFLLAPVALAVAISACTGVTRMTVDDVDAAGPPPTSDDGGDAATESSDEIDGDSDAAVSVVQVLESGVDSSPSIVADGSDAGKANASPFVGSWSCAAAEYYVSGDGGTGVLPGVVVLFAAAEDGTLLQTLETPDDGGEGPTCSLAFVVSGSVTAAIGGQSCPVWEDGVAIGALTSETFTSSGSTAIESATFAMRLSDGGAEPAIYSASCIRN